MASTIDSMMSFLATFQHTPEFSISLQQSKRSRLRQESGDNIICLCKNGQGEVADETVVCKSLLYHISFFIEKMTGKQCFKLAR